jgi:hypothetical protein
MRNFIDFGVTTPPLEDCAKVGSGTYDYYDRARREARALIHQLRRLVGPEPDGAQLTVKSHPHDFGTYLTVVCYCDDVDPLSSQYALLCDEKLPQLWDALARQELNLPPEEGCDP